MTEGRLQGKNALVTGAGSGIGKAIATTFAREGARVMASDLNEDTAKSVAAQIEDSGGEAKWIRTDTTNEDDVKAAIAATVSAFGSLDVMVNNAGIGGMQYSWDQIVDVNQNGVYYGLLHAFRQMVQQGSGGAMVNLASMMGIVGATPPGGLPGGVGYAYHASKHAVVGLTKQFGLDGAPHNIRVNAMAPGWIDTPLVAPLKTMEVLTSWMIDGTPMGRLGRPEEVAKAALFLASEDASFVTGHTLVIDGGWTLR
jgi:NAD(P)-dependent dehydrogenase (short-subunit alcohol dehydrogenase family)